MQAVPDLPENGPATDKLGSHVSAQLVWPGVGDVDDVPCRVGHAQARSTGPEYLWGLDKLAGVVVLCLSGGNELSFRETCAGNVLVGRSACSRPIFGVTWDNRDVQVMLVL